MSFLTISPSGIGMCRVDRYGLIILVVATSLVLPLYSAAVARADARNRLVDIRHWSAPTSTRIVFDLKQEADYESSKLTNPERITLTLNGFDGFMPKDLLTVNDGIVKNVRMLQDRKGTVRVVIELEKPAQHNIFPLRPIDGKLPRLVVDIVREDLEQAEKLRREATRQGKKQGEFIVVIDPGHGGEDPGAISKNGTQEKDVVFAIARKLSAHLNQMPGVTSYLTRNGDYFIPLHKRIQIAKEYGADAFVSIHVNAGFSPKVSGSSVYCLSFKGASSNAARLAAHRENASDSIGGVPFGKDDGVNAILYDMVQTHTLNTSMRFAELLLGELSKINKLHTHTPQQANFAVLRSLDIPSVLIETDFISNPAREQALLSSRFQADIVKAIAASVRQYAGAPTPEPDKSLRIAAKPSLPASSASVPTMQHTTPTPARTPATDPSRKKMNIQKTPPVEAQPVPGYRIVKKSDTQYALEPVGAHTKAARQM
ncbi:MAG: N-acetylmuramoyl-L-alanine amidase, partial [Desulfobacterota bacterium]|nr:N-acetylmuramoyl-L-alanine amidase [Thermodesulfobacteriota bacterium]